MEKLGFQGKICELENGKPRQKKRKDPQRKGNEKS
jgi:hypothetical protein